METCLLVPSKQGIGSPEVSDAPTMGIAGDGEKKQKLPLDLDDARKRTRCSARSGPRNRGKGLPRAESIPHLFHRLRALITQENMGRMPDDARSEDGGIQ